MKKKLQGKSEQKKGNKEEKKRNLPGEKGITSTQ